MKTSFKILIFPIVCGTWWVLVVGGGGGGGDV
jgi:hypothetical protein